jgi:ABC-type nitrate/sulfonate/bicarbonate transport system permease component
MSAAWRRGQGRGWGWRWGAPAVVAGLVIGLWYTVSYRLLTADTRFLVPPPDAVVRVGFLDPLNRAELLDGLLLSTQVAMLGLASAAVVGICLAVMMSQAPAHPGQLGRGHRVLTSTLPSSRMRRRCRGDSLRADPPRANLTEHC